ncbi:IS21 family transposase [Dyadobacter helix]|nr:IS21 family transposase [Dyadobacter sp. CECT 9275]
MQKLRQVLLLLNQNYSERNIVRQTGISRPTVRYYRELLGCTGQDYQSLLKLKDVELEALVRIRRADQSAPGPIDLRAEQFAGQVDYFMAELKRKGVTRQLLWQEYLKRYADGFRYSRFCELLEQEISARKPVMHFTHRPAELLEVDFAGSKLSYVDLDTGEMIECPVLVGVLPFSGYSYAVALPNASLPHVVDALNKMLDYFGGVPLNVLSDNMKQWVVRSSRYEPVFPQVLEQWATHNHIGLLATRVASPTDKASVENQVRILYRRVYALIRDEVFHSLAQLNSAITQKLQDHHRVNFQRKTYSRLELFLSQEKSLLQALPGTSYQLRHLTKGKVQRNYHVVLGEDWHYYSVPHTYLGKEVNLVYDSDYVEIYYKLERIALHIRSYKKHGLTTLLEHMPEHHRKITEQRGWDPDYYLAKASRIGPNTRLFF